MKPEILLDWEKHPVTQILIRLLKEHQIAHEERIIDIVLSAHSAKDVDKYMLAALKGQIHTIEFLLDTDSFFHNELQDKQGEGKK